MFCGRAYGIMFLPVLGKAQRGISNSPRLLSLTGWCFPPLALVMTIHFCVVGHEREDVCIFMIFPSYVLPAARRLSILGPQRFTSVSADRWIFLDGAIIPIVPALAIPMAVTVLNVSFVFGIYLQLHLTNWTIEPRLMRAGIICILSFSPCLHSTLLSRSKRPPAVSPSTST